MDRRRFLAAATSLAAGTPALSAGSSRAQETVAMSDTGFRLPPGATDCHVHVFDPERFPYASGRRYTPPPATVDDLLRLHERLGVERAVLVQPSVYGTDNRCLLSSLRRLGRQAVGIAVIDRDFGRSRLEDLAAAGVRGVRINLEVGKNEDPGLAAERLLRTAEQTSGSGLLIQLYAALPVIVACREAIASIDQCVLIDHFGLAKTTAGVTQPGFDGLLALLARPNVWMKLSGPYQISDRGPTYDDLAPIARALLAAAPTRCVWGSDWPHTGGSNRPAGYKPTDLEPFRREDDGRNLGLVASWTPDPAARTRLLVDNPAQLFGFR